MNTIPAISRKMGLFPTAGSANHSWRLESTVSYTSYVKNLVAATYKHLADNH